MPSYKAFGKFFTRLRTEDASCVIGEIDFDERDLLCAAEPETFHVTDHYRNYRYMPARRGGGRKHEERAMRAFLLLIIVVAMGAGFLTRPTAERHQQIVETLTAKGLAPAAPEGTARELLVDDFYVFTHSRVMARANADETKLLECWGAYTRFLCTRPAGADTLAAGQGG